MRPPPYDCWILARLLSGQPLDGELASISEPWRPIAEHLDAMPPGGRQAPWDGFLIGRSDPGAIIHAVADVDPLGPPPADEPAEPAAAPLVKMTCTADIT